MREVIKDAISKISKDIDCDAVLKMIDRLVDLHNEARKEGFLALQEMVLLQVGISIDMANDDWEIYRNQLYGADKYLVAMVMLMTNGAEKNEIRDIAVSRYYSGNFSNTEALCACIVAVGVLSIQAMESLYTLRERLYALLPKEIEALCINRNIEKEKNDAINPYQDV